MSEYELLYPLADAFELTLLYNKSMKAIEGKRHVNIKLTDDLEISSKLEVKASYVGASMSAIMVKVKKHLHLYLVYDHRIKTVTLHVVDAKGTSMEAHNYSLVKNTYPISVVNNLGKNIVASFKRPAMGIVWEKTNAVHLESGSGPQDNQSTGVAA